jgi:hypothetical protein
LPRLKLFFDLVFVFALSQLSHHLVEQPSLLVAAETLVLLLAVYAEARPRVASTTAMPPVHQIALPGLGPEGEDPGLPAFSLYFDRADLVPDDGFN